MLTRHFILLPFLAAGLAGCVTASPRVEEGELAKLQAEGSGIVLIHTSLNDFDPAHVAVTLARPDGPGRYAVWRQGVPIKFTLDSTKIPGQLRLPAGEYGIVELFSVDRRESRRFKARDVKLEGALLNKVYERPLATFKIGPGEVVDIGSLRVAETRRETTLSGRTGGFAVKVTDMPEPLLRNLAEHNPHLFKARVVRPMVVPAQNPADG